MDNTYTLFGFDAETNMVPFTAERLTVGEAKEFARENGLGSFFITPSNREQFPRYKIIHYLPNGDGTHRKAVHCEWLARTFSFTQKFPVKDSALYIEIYGEGQ